MKILPDSIVTFPCVGPVSPAVTAPLVPIISQLTMATPLVPSLLKVSLTSAGEPTGSCTTRGSTLAKPISPLASAVVTLMVAMLRGPILGLLKGPISGAASIMKNEKIN